MTPEEEQEFAKTFSHMIDALALIEKEKGEKGVIECPACNNDLQWTRAKINGHVWGKCKTENCLSWMQ